MLIGTNESWLRKCLVLGGALLLGALSASLAFANVDDWRFGDWRTPLRDHADNVNYLSREVRSELVHVANHSCLFGKMMTEVGRLEGQAAVLRGWSRHQAPLRLEVKVHELAATSDRLQVLIEEAWQRGLRGFHRPLLCTQRLRGLMARVDSELAAAYHLIPNTQTGFTPPRPCEHWGGVGPTWGSSPGFGGHSQPIGGWHTPSTFHWEFRLDPGLDIHVGQPTFRRPEVRFFDTSPAVVGQPGKLSAQGLSGQRTRGTPSHASGRHAVGRRFPTVPGDRR
jgi:hypothetical protein